MVAGDRTRAIISSLFSIPAPPNQPPATAQEQHLTHVQTFEGIPGSASRKARFLIISALKDGRLKLHKAKENSNGTFSIGKTWPLEDLRAVEVAKRQVEGYPTPQPLEFVLTLNGKMYRYETELPSSQQAAFLVKMVRCWRTYQAGRGVPDLTLLGFSVDNQRPTTPNSAAPPLPGGQTKAPIPPPPPPGSPGYPAPPPSSTTSNFLPSSSTGSSQPPPPSAPLSSSQSNRNASTSSISRPNTANANTIQSQSQSLQQSQARRPSVPNLKPSNSSQQSLNQPLPPQQPQPPAAFRNGSSSSTTTTGLGISRSLDQRSAGPMDRGGGGPIDRGGPSPFQQAPLQEGTPPKIRNGSSATVGVNRNGSVLPTDFIPPGMVRVGSVPSSSTNGRGNGTSMSATTPLGGSNSSAPGSPGGGNRRIEEEVEEEDTVLSNVEEMLEGFEWRPGGGVSGSGSASWNGEARRGGRADEIEKRLVGELKALEAASIHAIMESDDRVTLVIKHLDDALAELDRMDQMMGMYKHHFGVMSDDIAHIEGQNRGLQVQTSNQRSLLSELDTLLETIHIPDSDLAALSQESLENPQGIERLEKATVSLYKALLSTRDTAVGDMAAASERGAEYRQKASQFCKRIFDFLSIMFKFQVDQLMNPKDGVKPKIGQLASHAKMEDFLGRYCGLMLFVKEIDYNRYQQICAAYFTSMSDLHRQEIQGLMSGLRSLIRKPTEEELEAGFVSTKDSPTLRQQSMKRVGTVVRGPEGRSSKDQAGKISSSEAFSRALVQITPHIIREQGFISDFLAINEFDSSITFADYMSLENYFRRGATGFLATQQTKLKDIKAAMDLVFGFFESEIRDWIDAVLKSDTVQIVGVLAALDRAIVQGEEVTNEFLLRVLQKQYHKSLGFLERACKEQIRSIEQTKVTLKKRKGVVPFVRTFPMFVARVESQLEGADDLNIREVINADYERMISTIFESLQQMAKMDGEGHGVAAEDKDQLNYHVIIIENMHHIITVFSKQKVAALSSFVAQAREKYTQNLDLYIKLVLRRPIARLLDFFQGLEQLLRTTPPTEVSLHSAYTKAALRRATSDVRAKDLRKAIDALYKRVDKHFGDVLNPSAEHTAVIKTVWKACEDEMQRLAASWKGLIDKCYPDERAGLEFTREDIHEFFSKAHTS